MNLPASTPMSLADYINFHAGETAWLFGKGPSFADFDFSQAGPLRVAINDVAAHVPDCRYCFANDGVARWSDAYRAGQVLFQPERCLHEYDSTRPGAVACKVVTFEDDHVADRLLYPRERLAERLAIRRGTLGSALQILRVMGVARVELVGIDGGNTHAPGYHWRTRLRAQHFKDYNSIRAEAIETAELLGIALNFYNADTMTDNDGKIFVKFNKTVLAEGEHRDAGTIAKIGPLVARQLITMGFAEEVAVPAAPVIETAAAPMAAVENATVKTSKKATKRGKR